MIIIINNYNNLINYQIKELPIQADFGIIDIIIFLKCAKM